MSGLVYETWMDDAVCAQVDGDLWLPEWYPETVAPKRICWTLCPVREQCLAYSIQERIEYGIWGGVGVGQRRKMTRRAA